MWTTNLIYSARSYLKRKRRCVLHKLCILQQYTGALPETFSAVAGCRSAWLCRFSPKVTWHSEGRVVVSGILSECIESRYSPGEASTSLTRRSRVTVPGMETPSRVRLHLENSVRRGTNRGGAIFRIPNRMLSNLWETQTVLIAIVTLPLVKNFPTLS